MTRRELWIVGGVTALAALIRFATLDHQSFDHDEAATAVRVLHANLGDTLSVVGHGERSPPLYYILAAGAEIENGHEGLRQWFTKAAETWE